MSQLNKYKLNNNNINLINIKLRNGNVNQYLNKSFGLAFNLLKDKFSYKLINGPINKDSFLKKKFLGVTEYISHKFKVSNPGMLIYNKKLSVVPLTTHLPLKMVSKKISKKIFKKKN